MTSILSCFFIIFFQYAKIKFCEYKKFPDHYNYSDQKIYDITSQAKKLNCKILTTEKDFLRLKGNNSNEIKFIKSELKINNENDFLNILSDLHE